MMANICSACCYRRARNAYHMASYLKWNDLRHSILILTVPSMRNCMTHRLSMDMKAPKTIDQRPKIIAKAKWRRVPECNIHACIKWLHWKNWYIIGGKGWSALGPQQAAIIRHHRDTTALEFTAGGQMNKHVLHWPQWFNGLNLLGSTSVIHSWHHTEYIQGVHPCTLEVTVGSVMHLYG